MNLAGTEGKFLRDASRPELDVYLDGTNQLIFDYPFDGARKSLIISDVDVIYKGRRFVIDEIHEARSDDNVKTLQVTCIEKYVALGGINMQVVNFVALAPQNGLDKILQGTGWTVGTVDTENGQTYSMSEKNQSKLWVIRQWARIVGMEVKFDSLNRTVSLLQAIGEDRGVGFRYRQNVKGVERVIVAPTATVIWPYGRGGLSIVDVNDGVPYLEDYDWYTAQGLSLTEARFRFKKEYVWEDNRFLLPGSLKQAAGAKLAQMSAPQISYTATVLDLARIVPDGVDPNAFDEGDYVTISDTDLGFDVQTRILRKKIKEDEPWDNEFEFNYLLPGLESVEEDPIESSDIQVAQPSVIRVTNSGAKTISANDQNVASLSVTAYASTNATAGFLVVGQASAAGELHARFAFNGEAVGPEIVQQVTTGYNTIGAPFLLQQVPQGSAFLDVFVRVTAGSFTIADGKLEFYLYATNLLGGLSSDLPRPVVSENYSFNHAAHKPATHEAAAIVFPAQKLPSIAEHANPSAPGVATHENVTIEFDT